MDTREVIRIDHLVEELIQLLSSDKDAESVEIVRRVKWLQQMHRSLQSASSEQHKKEILQEMQPMLRGGMGRFSDIRLSPNLECGMSAAGMNVRFGQLVNELYTSVEQVANELRGNEDCGASAHE